MRVLHIIKTAIGATWAYEQMCALQSLGVDVYVALPRRTDGMASRYEAAGIKVIEVDLDLPTQRPWEIPSTLQVCRDLVQQIKPDLIHTHYVGTILVLRFALGRNSPIPRIFGVTGTLHLEHPFFAWLDMHSAGENDYWIATCRWTQRKYQELGISPDHVFLCYLGTETDRYSTTRSGILRQQLGIADNVRLVGMVSMIYPPKWFLGAYRGHKGHEDFIVAFSRLRECLPELRGVLIGGLWGKGQWYEERVKYLAERLGGGNLNFLGTRADLADIYPDLDLAVVPSYSDGLAYSVAEPLLAEVPVVATDVGGLVDLIKDGETGWPVKPGNPAALTKAVHDALERPLEAKRRAREGRRLARKLLDFKTSGLVVLDAYRAILSRATRPARDTRNEVALIDQTLAMAKAFGNPDVSAFEERAQCHVRSKNESHPG